MGNFINIVPYKAKHVKGRARRHKLSIGILGLTVRIFRLQGKEGEIKLNGHTLCCKQCLDWRTPGPIDLSILLPWQAPPLLRSRWNNVFIP